MDKVNRAGRKVRKHGRRGRSPGQSTDMAEVRDTKARDRVLAPAQGLRARADRMHLAAKTALLQTLVPKQKAGGEKRVSPVARDTPPLEVEAMSAGGEDERDDGAGSQLYYPEKIRVEFLYVLYYIINNPFSFFIEEF